MAAILQSAPRRVCILRLSALGDACHVLPVVRTLQAAWRSTEFTWIIGSREAALLRLVDGVEFITFDKRAGLAEHLRVARLLARRRFDVLLHMQLALRASAVAATVRAPVKLGFDRPRAQQGQWLFTNHRIAPRAREHVLDSLFGFAEALGVRERHLRWDLPLPEEAVARAQAVIPDRQPTMILSPCSSQRLRNWSAAGYARVADHAVRTHGMRVVIVGSPAPFERAMAEAIVNEAREPLVNIVGTDTLPQLLALLSRASVLVTPDSGPAHMATMVGAPVIGLYAVTNPERSGPYLSRRWCVNRYPDAARRFLGKDPGTLPWTTKIKHPGAMELIRPDDVVERLDALARNGFSVA